MRKFLLSIFAVMLSVFSVQAQTYVYQKVTSAPSDWSGDYLIVYEDGNVAFNGGLSKLDATSNTITVAISNNKIAADATTNAAKFTIAKSGDSYTIKNVGGYYIGATSNANTLSASFSEMTNTISWEDGSPKIVAQKGAVLRYNATSGQTRFRYFKSGTYKNQKAIALYKYTEESGETPEPEQPEIPVETVATPIITPETTTFNEGESVFVSIATETQDAEIYYTLDGTDPSTENGELYEGEIEITETTTVKAIAVKDGWNNSEVAEAKYTKTVVVEGGVVDVLNLALTGAEGTTYSSWSGKTSKSSAVYAGQSAGGNNSIQLRSSNSNSGIVTTQSGGKVKKISIDWNSNTAATRELWVYGKNTAYTNPTELYNASTDGDKLAEIACGTTEFIIEGDYEYIGLRSGSGAMYLNSIEITWVEEEEEPVAETWSSFYAAFPVAIPEGVEAYIVTAANAGYVTLTQIYNAVPANTGVILKGGSIEATNDNYYSGAVAEVTGNLLQGTMANTYISEEAYVLGCVDGEYGFYKADMNQQDGTAWLANAGKAYLPASAVPASAQGAANFSFRFGEGTTAIENVEVENEVKAIFDLTGRRVEAITAPGIYIVGGKKVLVK
ncbi:MAG: chitobiase/beta-hexosaminidase C-terminal domain-containing protein [Bacteroidaceae bacterium]|nr:chitobiase/beta-hexosaminidase C-terminal domain-containing protein [Bacteroidaceae bacterium]